MLKVFHITNRRRRIFVPLSESVWSLSCLRCVQHSGCKRDRQVKRRVFSYERQRTGTIRTYQRRIVWYLQMRRVVDARHPGG